MQISVWKTFDLIAHLTVVCSERAVESSQTILLIVITIINPANEV